MIGTNLVPEKNPSTLGIWNVWNLLYKNATQAPIIIPPNTDVCIDVIPTFLPTTEDGTPSYQRMLNEVVSKANHG